MNAQELIITKSDCYLDTSFLPFVEKRRKSEETGRFRGSNPWLFVVLLLCASLFARGIHLPTDLSGSPTSIPSIDLPLKDFFLSHKKISDPKKWISQIRELGFCQPDKAWKSFPVLAVSNDSLSSGFEQVALNPKANLIGDVQSIEQNFDIRDPKKFGVQQKKNGKLLEIWIGINCEFETKGENV